MNTKTGNPQRPEPPFYALVSPEQAAVWLSQNPYNRPLKESLVAEYARKMESGEWRERGGDPIWITAEGELVNGQHKLSAVVRLGRPVLLKVQVCEKPSVTWKEWHEQHKKVGL